MGTTTMGINLRFLFAVQRYRRAIDAICDADLGLISEEDQDRLVEQMIEAETEVANLYSELVND